MYDLKPQSQLVVCAFTGGPRADFIKKKYIARHASAYYDFWN